MNALNRKLWRDLWRLRGQAVATALVIASGVAIFVMTLGLIDSLDETRAAYYERFRFAQVFAMAKRAPDHIAAEVARIPGVQSVATRIVHDVILDVAGMAEPVTGRLISVPERERPALNDLALRAGRWVEAGRPDEVIVSEDFADGHGLAPGDHLFAIINGKKRRLDIVGVALSPEYVYAIAPGALMPDKRRFGILWMGHDALSAAFDLEGAFNDISLSLLRNASEDDVIDRLDVLLEPYGGIGAYPRDDQISEWFLDGEIKQLESLASVLPAIFIAVAAFLLNMVLSRLVAMEREQIGLLKAFGYGNLAIAWHYLKLVAIIAALGVVVGFAAGAWLGRETAEQYTQFYRFPILYYRPNPDAFAIGALAAFGAAFAGALAAVLRRQVVRVGEVRLLGVDREAPLDAAEGAARPDLVAPDDSTAAVGVEGVADAGLLADDDEVAAARRRHQHRRRAEVEVGAVLLRTVRVVAAAVEDERVVRRELVRPSDRAGLEVERDDRVARGGGGLGVGVAGRA